ncbi:Gfo/Idh/MocA family protein [Gluconacetobacter sacchari]|uniref:Gfo/Idh/MocA family oxidoreductase n=2 Tax=Gluconacetobacter sacchari TaxID=92759 RepID=A0A7W4IEJ6_9PROT|nr:Gfo/Idh/MocA family oxidoreductase [Gluconacetobacter sacchari]MBB2161302.1 Gfo/Idh/MocA family oxidoreductase [Gluconacetobacter sacchari]GBQ23600.1 oxidoreductase [Gluconacetobacter sacchari DSM 12717]
MKNSLGWGLIGASNVAREWIIDAIRAQRGNHIRTVLSRDAARGAAFAQACGIPASTTELDEILRDPMVDAVYVSTENALHHDQVLAAARAGKHVLCEKPLALSVREAQEMVDACRAAGVVMATNHHLRCSALHIALHEHLKAGAIGRLNSVRVFHANFLAAMLGGWRLNDAGGGVFLDSTIHDVDTLRFHLDGDPTDVFAMAQSGRRGAGGVEDGIMAVLRFPDDVLVQIHGAYSVPFAPGGIEFYGDKGVLIGRDCMSQRPIGTLALRDGDGEREIPLVHHNLYHFALQCFTRAVAGEGRPAATGEDGVASLAIALALKEAARTGRQVRVGAP